jgi:hypothetical protein
MPCDLCSSMNLAEFAGELTLHFPGSTLVTKPRALMYPMISVCMDCGASRFTMYDADLQELRDGIAPAA